MNTVPGRFPRLSFYDILIGRGDKMVSEAQKRATRKYDAANTKQYHLKLNLTTDADIIDRLKQAAGSAEGVQGYIKRLIREDAKKPIQISFPAVDGYRDEDAIRECQEKDHRVYANIVNNWEVRIDVDAKKVLTVKDRSGLSVPGHRRIL